MSTTPLVGSAAFKAYHKGREARNNDGTLKDNPYMTRRVIGLSNWWVKGFNLDPIAGINLLEK